MLRIAILTFKVILLVALLIPLVPLTFTQLIINKLYSLSSKNIFLIGFRIILYLMHELIFWMMITFLAVIKSLNLGNGYTIINKLFYL